MVDADNDNADIHHNMVVLNGGLDGAGGGISLYTGTDDYRVTDNFICGNFSMGHGGGIGHLGLNKDDSKNDVRSVGDDDGIGGFIARNDILFNESFNQGTTVDGGGVFIGGGAPPAGALSQGSGSVTLEANRILGNLAGAGNGAGIALLQVNGEDVADSKKPEDWYQINLFDNIVVNNIAALAGGGIHLRDTVKANIIHNTVARNDSTATAGNAFAPGSPNLSTAQPAGIVARGHDALLTAALPPINPKKPSPDDRLLVAYANPRIVDTIVWENRSFVFTGPDPYELVPAPTGEYDDLAVLGAAGCLEPTDSVLTSLGPDPRGCTYNGAANNGINDPLLTGQYINAGRGSTVLGEEIAGIQVPAAFDEGGNFIKVRFGPLSLEGTTRESLYHTDAPVAGLNLTGEFPQLLDDFDGDTRPIDGSVDIGADQVAP